MLLAYEKKDWGYFKTPLKAAFQSRKQAHDTKAFHYVELHKLCYSFSTVKAIPS
jgi:hypothetical protein